MEGHLTVDQARKHGRFDSCHTHLGTWNVSTSSRSRRAAAREPSGACRGIEAGSSRERALKYLGMPQKITVGCVQVPFPRRWHGCSIGNMDRPDLAAAKLEGPDRVSVSADGTTAAVLVRDVEGVTMFYCDPCAAEYGYPETIFKSYGPCECCGYTRRCSERPSHMLPTGRVLTEMEVITDTRWEELF